MSVRLRPAQRLRGTIAAPGDKSISHRALVLNALAEGEASVEGLLASEDCLRSMACLRLYGVQFRQDGNDVRVRSPGRQAFKEPAGVLDCGNSGTTMRLLAGVAAGFDGLSIFDGDASLRTRPMARVLRPLAAMGARVDGREGGSLAPFAVRGGPLRPFVGRMEVASAQVKSAILLAALAADAPSRIEEIAPTRDHTEIMLEAMGAEIQRAANVIEIVPGRPLRPLDVRVPGDISAAAFWLVAGSIGPDAEIELPGVGINPTRSGVLDVLQRMGATIAIRNERRDGGELVADITVRSAPLRGIVIDGDLVPRAIDELPVLAVAAAFAEGVTEVRGAAELRLKESDRIASTTALLRALGADVEERADGFRVRGGAPLRAAALESGGDHRLAMAAAVAAICLQEGVSELRDEGCIAVSYPQFWQHLDELTGAEAIA
ncbi:MAG: 3-phosphoshikimate 1-carboxyvinyltransferase [Dehalococcoidia bacterium]